MSQVFAAINHRLSEEYSKIELPHAEAKSRSVQTETNITVFVSDNDLSQDFWRT